MEDDYYFNKYSKARDISGVNKTAKTITRPPKIAVPTINVDLNKSNMIT
jgi:hypothetical protein